MKTDNYNSDKRNIEPKESRLTKEVSIMQDKISKPLTQEETPNK